MEVDRGVLLGAWRQSVQRPLKLWPVTPRVGRLTRRPSRPWPETSVRRRSGCRGRSPRHRRGRRRSRRGRPARASSARTSAVGERAGEDARSIDPTVEVGARSRRRRPGRQPATARSRVRPDGSRGRPSRRVSTGRRASAGPAAARALARPSLDSDRDEAPLPPPERGAGETRCARRRPTSSTPASSRPSRGVVRVPMLAITCRPTPGQRRLDEGDEREPGSTNPRPPTGNTAYEPLRIAWCSPARSPSIADGISTCLNPGPSGFVSPWISRTSRLR